jgi:hypothetical protein
LPPLPRRSTSSKSSQFTFRLSDDDNGAIAYPASYFALVADGHKALHDALYESGKRHFAAGHLERALVDFRLAIRQLERNEGRSAKRDGRRPDFDPEVLKAPS